MFYHFNLVPPVRDMRKNECKFAICKAESQQDVLMQLPEPMRAAAVLSKCGETYRDVAPKELLRNGGR